MSGFETETQATGGRRSLLLILPLLVFAVLAGAMFVRLRSGADPAALPSTMIGKPFPTFALPAVPGLAKNGAPVPGLAPADFKGGITVVNVFASWCAPCQVEHPMLMRLAREPDIRLVGIDYKEPDPAAGLKFLDRHGVPFAAVGADTDGRVAIDLGVYGVPETFVIGPDGIIRDKIVGILTPENFASMLKRIRAAGNVAEAK